MPTGLRQRLDQHALLRDRVGHHLSTLAQVIDSLRRELADQREEIRTLSSERDRLQSALSRADLLQADRVESEARWRQVCREYEREVQVGEHPKRDQQRMVQHCAELEQALAVEQEERRTLEAEVTCLQDQVVQLTEIVRLLMDESQAS